MGGTLYKTAWEMANAVIRQLGFENLAFDFVMTGSMFEGGPRLIEPMQLTSLNVAPRANMVHLSLPPVLGAVMLGMEADGLDRGSSIRKTIADTMLLTKNSSARPA